MDTLDIKEYNKKVFTSLTKVITAPTPESYTNFLSNLKSFVKQMPINEIKKRKRNKSK